MLETVAIPTCAEQVTDTILRVRITRDKLSGEVITYLQSKVFEDFFLSTSPYKEEYKQGSFRNIYLMSKATDAEGNNIKLIKGSGSTIENFYGRYNDSLLFERDYVNMSVLTAFGLGEGIEMRWSEPYSRTQLKNIKTKLEEAAKQLYREYIRPVSLEFNISAREVI